MKFFCTLFVAIILIGVWNVLEVSAAKSSETKSSTKPPAPKPSATKASATKAPATETPAGKSSQKVSTITPDKIKPVNVLSGHDGGFFSGPNGTFLKLVDNENVPEVIAYQKMQEDPEIVQIIPKYYGVVQSNGVTYVMLENVADPFGKDRSELDIKLGHRTFSEPDAKSKKLREDLYKKVNVLAPKELTEEEHKRASITKFRSMSIRDKISTSLSKGFRINAMQIKGSPKIKEFLNKTYEQTREAIASFLKGSKNIIEAVLKRLKQIRTCIAKSSYYKHREVTGSSIFFVRNEAQIGAWLVDFNKTIELPETTKVDHVSAWKQGNHEDGVLFGIDNLIALVTDIGSGKDSKKAGK